MFYAVTGTVITWLHKFVKTHQIIDLKISDSWGFPGSAVVKKPPANARDTGLSPGLGRSHMSQSN